MFSISTDARTNPRRLVLLFVGAFQLGSATAYCQDKLHDPAAAEALYLSGRKLIGDNNWTEGCEKFRASMQLNPAASTLINIAKCSEHEGKLTQALIEYRRASQLNLDTLGAERKRQLEQVVKDGITGLEPRLARVQLVVTNRPTGIEIKRDGLSLPIATIGETIPLDPGDHVFVVTAPGYRTEEKKVTLKEGETQTIELPLVIEEKEEKPKDDEKLKGDKTPPAGKDKPIQKDKPSGGAPVWAFVAGGVGLLAVGGSIYFKLEQSTAEKSLIDHCGLQLECDPNLPYDPAADNAAKNRSFGLFAGLAAVGAVGIGTAIFGFARGSGTAKPAPQTVFLVPYAGPRDGGVVLRGAF